MLTLSHSPVCDSVGESQTGLKVFYPQRHDTVQLFSDGDKGLVSFKHCKGKIPAISGEGG